MIIMMVIKQFFFVCFLFNLMHVRVVGHHKNYTKLYLRVKWCNMHNCIKSTWTELKLFKF